MTIDRAWQHPSEPNRIHYVLRRADNTTRHLYADRGSGLYRELEQLI